LAGVGGDLPWRYLQRYQDAAMSQGVAVGIGACTGFFAVFIVGQHSALPSSVGRGFRARA
jgi:hypothetical protein